MTRGDRPPGGAPVQFRAVGRIRLVLIALTAACVSACGGGADEPMAREQPTGAASRPDTTTPTTSAVTDSIEEAILAGYRAGWDAFLQAMDPPNPDHPALAATSTGRALEQTRTYLSEIRDRGNVLRGSMELAPEIRERTIDSAVLVDCVLDSSTEVPISSTEREGTPTEVGWEVHMTLVGDAWLQEVLYPTPAACGG